MSNFKKIESIRVSERVLDLVINSLERINEDLKDKVNGWQEVFYNCREQGFVLITDRYVKDNNRNAHEYACKVWACQQRNSDDIMIATSNKLIGDDDAGNSFDDESYDHARYFRYNEERKAANYAIKVIKENLHINESI